MKSSASEPGLILNQERTFFSFSETSFEKQCHKGSTRVIQPEKSGLEFGKSPLSLKVCSRGKLACA